MTWKSTTFASVFFYAILSAAHAQGADESKPTGWTPEAMLQLKQVGGVQVSPNGKKVAFAVRRAVMDGEKSEFVSQIHVANHDGTGEYALTHAEQSSDNPQWSPDGETIAFLSKRSDKTQVWLIRVQGGEARRLTDAKGGVISLRWSPDGQRVAYVATDPVPEGQAKKVKEKNDVRVVDEQVQRNRLYVIDVGQEAGKPEQHGLTPGDLSIMADTTSGFDWSPDGKTIVFAHVPTPGADDWTKSDLSVVDVKTGSIKPLVQTGKAETSPFFSPDGRWVAYAASDDPPTWAFDSAVHVVATEGGSPRKLVDSFDHRPELLGWTADGQRLLFRENRGTTTRLYALPLDGEPRGIGPEDGVVAEASLNPTRTAIGFNFQRADKLTEAFFVRLDGNESMKVSRVNDGVPDLPIGSHRGDSLAIEGRQGDRGTPDLSSRLHGGQEVPAPVGHPRRTGGRI